MTALLHLPFNFIMLHTLMAVSLAGSSGMEMMGNGSRSTVALKNLFTAFKLFLMKGDENKSNFIIISRTSLFKNGCAYVCCSWLAKLSSWCSLSWWSNTSSSMTSFTTLRSVTFSCMVIIYVSIALEPWYQTYIMLTMILSKVTWVDSAHGVAGLRMKSMARARTTGWNYMDINSNKFAAA